MSTSAFRAVRLPLALLGACLLPLSLAPAAHAALAAPTITAQPAALTNQTSASFSWTGVSGATFTCSLDGGSYGVCTSPRTLTGLAQGTHTFQVRQQSGGTVSTADSYSWTVDTTAPAKLTLSGAPAAWSRATVATFSWTPSETTAGASVQCKLDVGATAGSWGTCTSPKALSGLLNNTSYTFSVRQRDGAGNLSEATSASWTVDTTAPATLVLSGVPTALTKLTGATLSWTGEANATFQCQLDQQPAAACTSPRVLSGLPDGAHSLQVTQTDRAGNVSAPAVAAWTVDTVAVTPTLSGAPPAYTNSTSASISFSASGETGPGFSCSLDGGAYTACTSPRALTGLAQGAHTLAVKQTDRAGNTSTAATVSWTVDTTAPAAPAWVSKPAALAASTGASFVWTGEEGASFSCALDGGAYTACTSPRDLTGLTQGAHSFAVKQTDRAGNTSTAATASWTVDTVANPPTWQGPVPTNGSTTQTKNWFIGFDAEPGAVYACSTDGGAWLPCTSPQTLTGLADGPHSLAVRYTDPAGNVSAAATLTWTVDTVAPVAPTFKSKPNAKSNQVESVFELNLEPGATLKCKLDAAPTFTTCTNPGTFATAAGSHTIAFTQTDAAGNVSPATSYSWAISTTTPPAVTFTDAPNTTSSPNTVVAWNGVAGASFQCKLDSAAYAACTSPRTLTGLADGVRVFKVKQTDEYGNVSPEATVTWTVDTGSAMPVLNSASANPSKLAAILITVAGLESGATVQCKLDTAAWGSCPWTVAGNTASVTLTGLSDGPHSFQMRQTDTLGNVSPTASYNWTVDTAVPLAPRFTARPDDSTAATAASIGFSGEAGASFTCSVDGGTYASCTSPKTLSGLAPGPHSLIVKQTDAAGNVSPGAALTWTISTPEVAAQDSAAKSALVSALNQAQAYYASKGYFGDTAVSTSGDALAAYIQANGSSLTANAGATPAAACAASTLGCVPGAGATARRIFVGAPTAGAGGNVTLCTVSKGIGIYCVRVNKAAGAQAVGSGKSMTVGLNAASLAAATSAAAANSGW